MRWTRLSRMTVGIAADSHMGRRGRCRGVRGHGRRRAVRPPCAGLEDFGPAKELINGCREGWPGGSGGRSPRNEDQISSWTQFREAMADGFADAPLHQIAYHRFPHPLSY
jgi:hypothetical protein